nr:hypothetical protein [Tanacetum cinerariifolium]
MGSKPNKNGMRPTKLRVYRGVRPGGGSQICCRSTGLKGLEVSISGSTGRPKGRADGCDHGCLYLESDTGDDASQDIRDLRRSSSQLTIPVYPEVRDPRNPWACKEEIGLADAITANISRAEKKKRCRIVCRTHGVGSAHHARSDGVPVSAPTVVPQGLALLLVDAATQTESDDT